MVPIRRLFMLLCCICLLLALTLPVRAEEPDNPRELVQQMLAYFHHHQTAAKTDIFRLLEQLHSVDPEQAALWESIFTHWFYAWGEMPRNETVLADNLPGDDSLCIVVLGYALTADGNMKPELVGRLELVLEAAIQYPNAYVLCAGGGTASENRSITEAGQMARWLKKNSIDSDRILLEDKSTHTVQNARFSIDLLTNRYPQVRQLVIVSSDYHLPRSSTLFHARALGAALETDTDPITIAACLGYEAGHEGVAEDPLDQTAHVARVMGFEYRRSDVPPPLSVLTDLTVEAPAELEIGQTLSLHVTAHYDCGYRRAVTEECHISSFDPVSARTQTVSITYAENGRQITATAEIRRPPKETTPSTEALPEVTLPPAPEPVPKRNDRLWLGIFPAASLFLLFFYKRRK